MAPKLFLIIALIGIIQMASSARYIQTSSSSSQNSGLFTADLFGQISKTKTNENIILSPLSIQTALAMVYLGAEDETASQLVQGLRLPSNSKEEVAKAFATILNTKHGAAELNIANRFFVNSAYQLRSTFNQLAQQYFNSEAESVDFSQSSSAIQRINTWVEQKTNNKITNLMPDGSVDGSTKAVIINAIYFKGKWQTPFEPSSIQERPFWVSQTKSVGVQTMLFNDKRFKYAVFPELDATAIELPYKDSNISMIIILPNKRDGLVNLEKQLSSVPINRLSSRLTYEDVSGFIPKFKIEFKIGLVDVLKELGIRSIFENTANLSGIFETGSKFTVSDVQHKAFIEVDETGTEAAAVTYLLIGSSSASRRISKSFQADHPFVFAISSPETIYFVGHIATF